MLNGCKPISVTAENGERLIALGHMEIPDSGLSPQYQTYERQKCFIGYSRGARWRADIESVCQQVLQGEFNLEPWYADEHPDPTTILRDKVVVATHPPSFS